MGEKTKSSGKEGKKKNERRKKKKILSEQRWLLLWWGVLDELDALLDITLETLDAGLEERLLLLGNAIEDVDGLLSTVGL